ncbi:hypothetical protein G4Y73_06350 [Wenzhouxiangella sp. XN201]|uniref:hypothetical protein n=1 Tax=Wenzhouxiangella sp. XN201 TaxID=2710755 RepID=UPI0013CAB437|nr:hypothetical protein [Wenzhouxiangella sp. XN201]NEZ03769.1 hypothetical protein [Wenzhouxiangella sp. XN201]
MKIVKVSPEIAATIRGRKNQLDRVELEPKDLISPLREWETRPTVAAKRIFSTLGVLSSTAFIVGVDYADIPFLGVPQGQGGKWLSLILFAGIVVSGFAYLWNRSIDLRVREFEFLALREKIKRASSCVDTILESLEPADASDFPDIRVVFDGSDRAKGQRVDFECQQLDAVLLYREKVSGEEFKRSIFERVEVWFLVGLASLGTIGLSLYWLKAFCP